MKLELPFDGSMSLNGKVPGEVGLPVLSFLLTKRKEHKKRLWFSVSVCFISALKLHNRNRAALIQHWSDLSIAAGHHMIRGLCLSHGAAVVSHLSYFSLLHSLGLPIRLPVALMAMNPSAQLIRQPDDKHRDQTHEHYRRPEESLRNKVGLSLSITLVIGWLF